MNGNNNNHVDAAMITIQPRKWYYQMSGYGGSTSTMVSPYEKTGAKDGGYSLLFGGDAGKVRPMVDEWYAIGLDGRVTTISANQMNTTGHIGIGTLEERFDSYPYLLLDDAEVLLRAGYSQEEIRREFATAWDDEEGAAEVVRTDDNGLTDKRLEMLRAMKVQKEKEENEEDEKAKREFAESKAKLTKELAYLPCKITEEHKWLRVGEVSRNLRAMLKHEFPGVKFSVRSESYSGGDSCHIEYSDGPAYDKVNKVVSRFDSKTYDGMQELEEYYHTAFHSVAGDFGYTFLSRNISEAIRQRIVDLLHEQFAKGSDENHIKRTADEIAHDTDFDGREIAGLQYIDKRDGQYVGKWEVVFKEQEKPTTPTGGDDKPMKKVAGVQITENKEKNGIEIRFPSKPEQSVIDGLKAHRWRWSRFGGCWYNRATDENRRYAESLAA